MEVKELCFEVTTLIGNARIPMKAYLELQVGDILLLEQQIEDPLIIEVGEEACFRGRPGLSETRKAVLINERIHS